MDSHILEQITAIFKSVLQHDRVVLTETTTTQDIDGWESATHMIIISEIEDQYNVEFELDELWSMKNIGDLIQILKSKL